MAAHDTIDLVAFRAAFPAFSNDVQYPDSLIQMYYANATLYIDENDNFCGGLNGARLDLALFQMTAHLLASADLINAGETPGIATAVTIDKVNVSLMPPPAANGWKFWLATTPYGMQLWAFLSMQAVGGWAVGGRPETRGFRKVGGFF